MASRWLTSVGKFLEKLDDQAKDVVEEQFRRKIETNSNTTTGSNNNSTLNTTKNNFDNNNYINSTSSSNDADSKINNLLAAKGLQLSFNSNKKQQSFSDSVSTTTTESVNVEQKKTHSQQQQQQQQSGTSGGSNSNSNFFDDNDDDFFQDTTTSAIATAATSTTTIPNDTMQTQVQQKQQQYNQKQPSQTSLYNENNDNAGWAGEDDDDFLDDIDMNPIENVNVTTDNAQIHTIETIEVAESTMSTHTTFPEMEQQQHGQQQQQQQIPELSPNKVNENQDQSILTSDENNFSEQHVEEHDLNNDHQQDVDEVVVDHSASTAASDANNFIDVLHNGEQNEDETMQIKPIEATATAKEMLQLPDSERDNEDVIDEKQTSSLPDTEFTNNSNTPTIDWDAIIQAKLQEQEMVLIQMSQEREEIIRNEYKNEIWNMNNTLQSLKNDLELSQREINAQQKELDTVAIRIDKDRIKNKEIIDTLNSRYNTDISSLKVQHDTSIKEMQKQHNEQIVSLKEQYRQLELSKIHEDATYNKDLDNVVQREQTLQQQYSSVVDEKEILLQQIETLQQQQVSLAGRIESLTVMSEGAYQREQESEHRYDDILQLHAKQLQQRQIRESELERTITELTAALAASSSTGTSTTTSGAISNQNGVSMMNNRDQLQIQIQTLEHENETIKIQLAHELARSTALEQEIQQITKDRDDDTNVIVNQIKQQYEQIITELQQKIGSQSDQANNDSYSNNKSSEFEQNDYDGERKNDDKKEQQQQQLDTYVKKIKSLNEEILRQREKLSSYSSEVSTLRTRLNVALNRATVAEAVTEQQQTQQQQIPFGSPDNNNNSYATSSVRAPGSSGMRINKRRNNNNNNETNFPSMRKAFMIDPNDTLLLSSSSTGSNCTTYTTITKFGNVLDATDTVLSKSGRVLRYNPFARLFFVMYLFSLHTWTFVVIFFHAHSLDHTNNSFNQLQLQQNGFPNSISSPHNLQPLLTLTQDKQKNGIVPTQVQDDVKKKELSTDTSIDNKNKA